MTLMAALCAPALDAEEEELSLTVFRHEYRRVRRAFADLLSKQYRRGPGATTHDWRGAGYGAPPGWGYGAPPGVPPPRPGVPPRPGEYGWQLPPPRPDDISRFGGAPPPAWGAPPPSPYGPYGPRPGEPPGPLAQWTLQPPGWGAPPPGAHVPQQAPPGQAEKGAGPGASADKRPRAEAGGPAAGSAAAAEAEEAEEELPPPPTPAQRLGKVRIVRTALGEKTLSRLKAVGISVDVPGASRPAPSEALDGGDAAEVASVVAAAVGAQCARLGLDSAGVGGGAATAGAALSAAGRARLPQPVPGPPRLPPCTAGISQAGLWELFREQCGSPVPADTPPMLCELRTSRVGGHVVVPVLAVSEVFGAGDVILVAAAQRFSIEGRSRSCRCRGPALVALGLLLLALAIQTTLPATLLRRMRMSAGQVAEEMKLAGRQYCCLAAMDAGDACGSCWDGAGSADSSWCGESAENCQGCGQTAFWCPAQTPEPTPAPTPDPAEGLASGELVDFASRPDASFYCISLIRPESKEAKLTRAQLDQEVGMFSCNAYTVFSNTEFVLREDPHVATEAIPGSLEVQRGGIWFTALNTDVFVRLWTKVFDDGRFSSYEWTIKLDADTVFFADRMRARLRVGSPYPRISYFNNCKIDDMHGPLEVLSRGAMTAFQSGIQRCRDSGVTDEELWGEDVFVRQCLDFLGVVKVNDWELLSETACDEDLSKGCISGKVAFHPFKDVDSYFKCVDEAKGLETSSTTQTATLLEGTTTGGRPPTEVRWLVDDSELNAATLGLAYRRTPQENDRIEGEWANWGDIVSGVLTEEGEWVRVGERFLPVRLDGASVLLPQTLWEADNSRLQDVSAGLAFRSSPSLDDKAKGETVLWGDLVEGSPTPDGAWLQARGKYLPMRLGGVPVLRRREGYGEAEEDLSSREATGAPGDHPPGVLRGTARSVAA
ncbi:unnamed protein product [Prorocentrum cordatum]|uniref:Uncharacterized protein n=1 Tax=Prorocentrum cordatum TaxID=2364126 RepID=A0ABN9VZP3_9DINO|nr:unnamed protein product [Polarella glacialis]